MTVSGPADQSSLPSSPIDNSIKEKAEEAGTVSSIAQNAIADRLAALKAKRKLQTSSTLSSADKDPTPPFETVAKAAPPPLPSSSGGKGKGRGVPPAPPPAPVGGKGKGAPPAPPLPGGKGAPPPPPLPPMGGPPMAPPMMGFAPASRLGIFDGLQKMTKEKDSDPKSPKKAGESKFTVYLNSKEISLSLTELDEVYVPLMEIVMDIIEYGDDVNKLLSFLKYKFPKKEGESFDSKEKQNFGIELRGFKAGLGNASQEELDQLLTFSADSLSLSEEETNSFEKLPKVKLELIQKDALNTLLKAESLSNSVYLDNFRGMLRHLSDVEDPATRSFLLDNFIEEPKGATERLRKIKLFYPDVLSLAESVSKKEIDKKKQEARKAEFMKSLVNSKLFLNLPDEELAVFFKKIATVLNLAEKSKGKVRDYLYENSGNFSAIQTMTEDNVKAIMQWTNLTEKLKKVHKHAQLFSTVLEELSAQNCLSLAPIGDDTEQNLDNFLALFSVKGLFREKSIIVYEIHNQFFKKFWPYLMDKSQKDGTSLHTIVHELKAKVESGEVKTYDELCSCLKV